MYRFFLVLFLSTHSLSAQFGPRQIINEDAGNVRVIRTADFDNDGDQDVVIASTPIISWYENLDGNGSFSAPISIQEGKGQSFSLFPADLDNDNNIDLVVSFFDEDEVVWYRNLGDGLFSQLQLISKDLLRARGVIAKDLDGDSDLDIVLGVSNGSGLYWVENLDGLGAFGPRITIDATISQARTQAVGDIDGDGDNDILTNAVGSSFVLWFENVDGSGSFTTQHHVDGGLYENTLDLVDIDGDNDLDIISEKSSQVIWRENTDGLGAFSNLMVISDQVSNVSEVKSADFDNDGDQDVVSASSGDNKVAWYKNEDGQGGFGNQMVIDLGLQLPRTVHGSDLDGDGDIDLLSSALTNGDKRLVWYENLTILGVDSQNLPRVMIYPSPARDTLHIHCDAGTIDKVEVYNGLGEKMKVKRSGQTVDVSQLSAGVYFFKVTVDGKAITKRVVKD